MTKLYLAVDGCPSPGVKTMHVDVVPSKRSAVFSWSYDADPEDYGISFSLPGTFPAKIFNMTVRKYNIDNLGTVYQSGQLLQQNTL